MRDLKNLASKTLKRLDVLMYSVFVHIEKHS